MTCPIFPAAGRVWRTTTCGTLSSATSGGGSGSWWTAGWNCPPRSHGQRSLRVPPRCPSRLRMPGCRMSLPSSSGRLITMSGVTPCTCTGGSPRPSASPWQRWPRTHYGSREASMTTRQVGKSCTRHCGSCRHHGTSCGSHRRSTRRSTSALMSAMTSYCFRCSATVTRDCGTRQTNTARPGGSRWTRRRIRDTCPSATRASGAGDGTWSCPSPSASSTSHVRPDSASVPRSRPGVWSWTGCLRCPT
jgi:hypothetical protein